MEAESSRNGDKLNDGSRSRGLKPKSILEPCLKTRQPIQKDAVLTILRVWNLSTSERGQGTSNYHPEFLILKYLLTDGCTTIPALLYSPHLELDERTPIGTAIRVIEPIQVVGGMMPLSKENVCLLGGFVEHIFDLKPIELEQVIELSDNTAQATEVSKSGGHSSLDCLPEAKDPEENLSFRKKPKSVRAREQAAIRRNRKMTGKDEVSDSSESDTPQKSVGINPVRPRNHPMQTRPSVIHYAGDERKVAESLRVSQSETASRSFATASEFTGKRGMGRGSAPRQRKSSVYIPASNEEQNSPNQMSLPNTNSEGLNQGFGIPPGIWSPSVTSTSWGSAGLVRSPVPQPPQRQSWENWDFNRPQAQASSSSSKAQTQPKNSKNGGGDTAKPRR